MGDLCLLPNACITQLHIIDIPMASIKPQEVNRKNSSNTKSFVT